ncbi:MAG: ribosome maturation factor RimM [Bauldia sp.]
MKDRVVVAVIGAAHGIKGDVRVKPFTDDRLAIRRYGPLLAADGRRFDIEAVRPAAGSSPDMLIVRFKGIASREAAEALTGTELSVPRTQLPEPDEDEFYHADLVGLDVVTADGARLGRVVAVQNFGAGELLEIAPPAGTSIFLPFTRAAVPTIDLAAGRVIIAPPAGLLEGGADDDAGSAG